MNRNSKRGSRFLNPAVALTILGVGAVCSPGWAGGDSPDGVPVAIDVSGDLSAFVGHASFNGNAVPGTWQIGNNLSLDGSDLSAVCIPITVNQYGSSPVINGQDVMFCGDYPKDIYIGTSYSLGDYNAVPLTEDGSYSYGNYPESAGIGSSSGIGADKAAIVQILFDKYYLGPNQVSYATAGPDYNTAFSLAVWKLTHEASSGIDALFHYSDQNFDLTGANSDPHFGYYLSSMTGGVPDYITTSQTWVDEAVTKYLADGADTGADLKYSLYALSCPDGQDVIGLAIVVPEPASWAFTGGLGLVSFAAYRRQCRA
jgi:hypothetical protein